MKVGFNKPYFSGKELEYISDALKREKISGDGYYTKLCHDFFQETYGFKKVLLTTSCTDALEMAALLLEIREGDEVIVPSYTFVSTANAFILRGAKIVFADSQDEHPNIDADSLRPLISSRTKAIVVVHYGGVACDMDKIMSLAEEFNLFVVEDAAQAINSFYKQRPLGSIGHLGCFSFHESKNIICGEGGMLTINDQQFIERAEIIWEKGTNRASFFRGEIEKYEWVDIGSSFLLSDMNAAFLYAQIELLSSIQNKRSEIWNRYYNNLKDTPVYLPSIPDYASNNAHNFYLVCKDSSQRSKLAKSLTQKNIEAFIHYLPLHLSPYFRNKHDERILKNTEKFSDRLLRLPFFYDLQVNQQTYVIEEIKDFFVHAQKGLQFTVPYKSEINCLTMAFSPLLTSF
jgi:dTDP-4-amino-4,6-dideoxygalactose transaminase